MSNIIVVHFGILYSRGEVMFQGRKSLAAVLLYPHNFKAGFFLLTIELVLVAKRIFEKKDNRSHS